MVDVVLVALWHHLSRVSCFVKAGYGKGESHTRLQKPERCDSEYYTNCTR